MADSLSIAVHGLVGRVSMSFLLDETLNKENNNVSNNPFLRISCMSSFLVQVNNFNELSPS